jgi:hypothetical protein
MLKKLLKKIYFRFIFKSKRISGEKEWQYNYRKDVLKYYNKGHNKELTIEEKNVINYLKKNIIHYFPYKFQYNYNPDEIEVLYDLEKDLRYVLHEKKKLYFKRCWNEERIKKAYNFLLIEQDKDSPHLYLKDTFTVNYNDTVMDVGSAEGKFALSIIEKVKKMYLFESDGEWIEPLFATFQPWENKVEIVNKFVSNSMNENSIKLDNFFKENVTFIKADVEGAEIEMLKGAKTILINDKPKIVVCTYHNKDDANQIESLLRDYSYNVTSSRGFMIFLDDMRPPYLRKGLIRAEKL